ncbi:MAG: polysaccharide deacetylase family protein [Colwellia sp.]|nr:polysaccharide deacetylase family protein [Colwellia sp.]
MLNKSVLKSLLIRFSGYEAYKWLTRKNGLYCFNYHRIGDCTLTPFDPNIYSCSVEQFKKQLQFIKKHFQVITLDEALLLAENKLPLNKQYALITFDDGYIDNYEEAYPVLKEEKISAVFFIPTDYVNSDLIPWWDEIAWMLKNTTKNEFCFGKSDVFHLNSSVLDKTIRNILTAIKSDSRSMDEKILELKAKLECEYKVNPKDKSLFVSWEQLKEMKSGGMAIGSHTCSHRILTHIDKENQLLELEQSKQCLEQYLGCNIDSIAYPVGQSNTFNQAICEMTQQLGYKIGFSFTNAVNDLPLGNVYQVSRLGIDNHPSIMVLKQKIIKSGKSE